VGLPERVAADAEPYPDGDQSDKFRAGADVQWTTLLKVSQRVTDASNKAVYVADLRPFLTKGGAVYVRW
jgi:hypothetical protein